MSPSRVLMKFWKAIDDVMTEFTVSSLQHIDPSNILNLAFSMPNDHSTPFRSF
jgi:hypothetical protein